MSFPAAGNAGDINSVAPRARFSLHPGEKMLAVGGAEPHGVRILDLAKGAVVQRLPHLNLVEELAFSPDGGLLATACSDQRIHLWETVSWRKDGELAGHRWQASDVAFDPSGKWLASTGWDMTLRVWELATRRQVLNLEDVRVVGFRREGGLAAAALAGRNVRVWGFRPSDVLHEMNPSDTDIHTLEFSPDSRHLVTSGSGADVCLWDVPSGRKVVHLHGRERSLWGPAGDWLLTQGTDGLLRVPIIASKPANGNQTQIQFGKPQLLAGLRENLTGMAIGWIGGDGERLFLVDDHPQSPSAYRIRVLALEGDRVRVLWEARVVSQTTMPAADPAGRYLAVGTFAGGNGVFIWEAETGRLLRELPLGDSNVAFSADGRRLFTTVSRFAARGAECQSWNVGSWTQDRAVRVNRISSSPSPMKVARDGTLAITHTMSDLRLLEPETLDEVATLEAPEPGLRAAFAISPDCATIAVASSRKLQFWNLRRLREDLAKIELDW